MQAHRSEIDGLTPGQLLALRCTMVAGLALALLVAQQFLATSPIAEMLVWVTGLLAVFNLSMHWYMRQAPRLTPREVQGQLLVDIATLTFFFYFAGGATNPFVDLFLVPIAIAAASLPWRYTLFVSLLSLAGYLLLVKWHIPLPEAREGAQGFQCVAMWIKYLLLAGLVAFLLYSAASRLRERERNLAAATLRRRHEEYLARAGALAAGAAHEMSAPLCTMAVLLNECLRRPGEDTETRNLQLASEQIEACRRILSELMTYGQGVLADGAGAEPADKFLHEVIAKWRLIRPGAQLAFRLSGARPAALVATDLGFGHAILNLLNNAADASPQAVEMNCSWSEHELRIVIADRGPGFPPEFLEALGRRCLTTKRDKGTGIGLLLARTDIERAGGRLHLGGRAGGGARAEVVLPLGAPQPTSEAPRGAAAPGHLGRLYKP